MERNYDFCKRLLEVHKKDRRDLSLTPDADEFTFESTVRILMPKDAGIVTTTAAKDFADYLFTSMNVTAYVDIDDGTDAPNTVRLAINTDLGEASERRGHRITVTDMVTVEGYDENGIAQGLYYLEDVMNLRFAPFIKKGTETRRVMFEPRTVMSGYGIDDYPDEYLARLAHHGFTQIMFWIRGINKGKKGFCNFKDIAQRAEKYGFDIIVESYQKHDVYPEGEEAQKYYDEVYGKLLARCPFISGLVIVGEAVDFQSRDPNLPAGTKPGWYPCADWVKLIEMIHNATEKVKPGVRIIISSYNWGFQPADIREKLVASYPPYVLMSCGWEMFEYYDLDGAKEACSDYSLRVAAPGQYFLTEAESAKKYGHQLQTISNTGGKTWDFGAIPYDPAPYRWAERCEALRKAHDENGLTALCDSIHFGVHTSFISEITKWAFAEPRVDLDELIPKILAMHFGRGEVDKLVKAMKLWSEAFANMVPTNEDQYGPLRIGPSYPLYAGLERNAGEAPPQDEFAMSKLVPGMYCNTYYYHSRGDAGDVRIPKEIAAYEKVKSLIAEGIEILDSIADKNEELLRLINMGRFMHNTVVTVLHTKRFFLLDEARKAETDKEKLAGIIGDMLDILASERRNAVDTIPYVEYDSALGFEPSIEYVTDRRRIEWKLAQVDAEADKLRAMM